MTRYAADRMRAPRVEITYDVETDAGVARKELPFVIGVLGNFSGMPSPPGQKLRDRRFIDVGRDNFDAVLNATNPRLVFQVDNKLSEDTSRMTVELHFAQMEDFEPEGVARQVDPLRRLIEARQRLSALRDAIRRDTPRGRRLRELIRNGEVPRGRRATDVATSEREDQG